MADTLNFQSIGMDGRAVGQLRLGVQGLEWKDRGGVAGKTLERIDIADMRWGIYGAKAQLRVGLRDGAFTRLDGFMKADYERLSDYCRSVYALDLSKEDVASDGGNFGELSLLNKNIVLKSASSLRSTLELKLDNVAQCVIPAQNNNEIGKIKFHQNFTIY
jgi:hypothetical protein